MLENTRPKPINDEMRNKTKSLVKCYFIVVDGGSRRALVVLIGPEVSGARRPLGELAVIAVVDNSATQ